MAEIPFRNRVSRGSAMVDNARRAALNLSLPIFPLISFILALPVCLTAQQMSKANQLLGNAIEAQQRGDFETAIRDYREVLRLHPGDVEAEVNLGAALVHVGQFDAGIAEYRSALPSLTDKSGVILDLGLAYYKKGDWENARRQFEPLHLAEPKNAQVAILLGDTYLRLKQAPAAAALLAPLEPANAENADLEYVLGAALVQAGQRREGVAHLEKAGASGNSADAYMLAGTTLLQINEFEQARRDLDEALRLDPKFPGIYTLAGTARDKTGDVAQAEAAFRQALLLNPNDFEANLYLGAILYKRRQLADAKVYLDKAIELNPSSSMARYEGAMLKSASGEYAAAAEDLEKLVRDDPKWLEPHVELAALYYRLHRQADGERERKIVDQLNAEQQKQGP
jgi:tetratricopeptide (TPR) repeat protein